MQLLIFYDFYLWRRFKDELLDGRHLTMPARANGVPYIL